MICIKPAYKDDMRAIQRLLDYSGKCTITPEHFNHKDIALQARNMETGEVLGFVWAGLMAKNTIMYIDKAAVHPEHSKKQILNKLYKELLKEVLRLNVKHVFGIIRLDQWHDRSAVNALKMGSKLDPFKYSYFYSNIDELPQEVIKGVL